MTAPEIVLRGERPYSRPAKYSVHFAITSTIELTTKPSHRRPFTMRATRVCLSWLWDGREWDLLWYIKGHRYRKSKGDWSPFEQGFMTCHDIDLPEWLLPLVEANTPTVTPTAEVRDEA